MNDENPIISSTCVVSPSDALVVVSEEQIRGEAAQAAARMADAYAKGTRRVYGVSWRFFEEWCAKRAIAPAAATPEIVATYLESRLSGGLSSRACTREYGGVAAHLRDLQADGGPWLPGSPPDVVLRWLKGAHKRARPAVKKRPLLPEHFTQLADRPLNGTLLAARDRAILLFGFAGGFRRSELVGLDVTDLELGAEGAIVHIRRSKTDQDSQGAHIAIWRQHDRRCPIAALEHYLRWSRIEDGPLFRSIRRDTLLGTRLYEDAVARIVKAAVASLGLNPREYAGHSLRCGFVTAAAMRGATLDEIMNTTRHRSADQVIAYIRRATPFERNASKGLLEDGPPLHRSIPEPTASCGRGHVDKNRAHVGSYCLQGECGEERGVPSPVRRIELRRS